MAGWTPAKPLMHMADFCSLQNRHSPRPGDRRTIRGVCVDGCNRQGLSVATCQKERFVRRYLSLHWVQGVKLKLSISTITKLLLLPCLFLASLNALSKTRALSCLRLSNLLTTLPGVYPCWLCWLSLVCC